MVRSIPILLALLCAVSHAQDVLQISGQGVDRQPRTIYVKDGKVEWQLNLSKVGKVRHLRDTYIYPGLVLADSGHLAPLGADARAVNTDICAADGYDPFVPRPSLKASGITSAYLSPGRQRFVPGCGSVIAVGVDPLDAVVVGRSALHIVLTSEAYNPPDLFKPAIPPGPDNPHTTPERQFPRSRAGAFAALRQVFDEAADFAEGKGPESSALPGQPKLAAFAEVLSGKRILRVRIELAADIRSLLSVVKPHAKVRLVIEGGTEAWKVAKELAAAKVGVIMRVGTPPSGTLPAPEPFESPRGDSDPLAAQKLHVAGVKVAIVPPRDGADEDLLWHALQSGLGGDAWRAITINAADLLGLPASATSDDFCIYDRNPFNHPEARPVIVISDGAVIHDLTKGDRPTAIFAKRVYTAKGDVIENGIVVVKGKKILDVGTDIVVPNGARRVTAESVMPGLIDVGGQVGFRSIADGGDAGLRPGTRLPAQGNDKRLSDMFDPRYLDVRPLAESGVTTIAVTPSGGRGTSGVLSIVKTSGADKDDCVVKEIGGLLFDLGPAGANKAELTKLSSVLKAGKKYKDSWDKYEKDLAEWKKKNPKAKAAKPARERRVGEVKAPTLSDPLTGTWEGTIMGFDSDSLKLIISARLKDDKVSGTIHLEETFTEPVAFKDIEFKDDAVKIEVEVDGTKHRFECATDEDRISISRYEDDGWKGFGSLRRTSQTPSHEAKAAAAAAAKKPAAGKTTAKTKSKGPPKAPKESAAEEPFRSALSAGIPVFLGIKDEGIAKQAIKMLRDDYECTTVVISSVGISKLGQFLSDNGCGFAPQGNPVLREKGERVVTTLEAVRRKIPVAMRSGWNGDGRTLYAAASHAVRCGVRPHDAMKMVTYWSALILNIGDRVGSIAPGRDADLLIVSGTPFQPGSRISRVMIDGRFLDETEGDN